VGSCNGFGRFGIEGGAERMGRGTVSRGGGQAAQSTRLPWLRRSRLEASGRQLHRLNVATAAARGRLRKAMVRVGRKANRPADSEWCRFQQAKAQEGEGRGWAGRRERGWWAEMRKEIGIKDVNFWLLI
jgi:hypothetical protein